MSVELESEGLEKGHDDHWYIYRAPTDSGKFEITPLAVIDHVIDEDDKELVKEFDTDEETGHEMVAYRVLSGVEYEDADSTQSSWDLEYGIECAENGLSRTYLNIDEEGIDNPEAYAASIFEDIFPELERRTGQYYGRD